MSQPVRVFVKGSAAAAGTGASFPSAATFAGDRGCAEGCEVGNGGAGVGAVI